MFFVFFLSLVPFLYICQREITCLEKEKLFQHEGKRGGRKNGKSFLFERGRGFFCFVFFSSSKILHSIIFFLFLFFFDVFFSSFRFFPKRRSRATVHSHSSLLAANSFDQGRRSLFLVWFRRRLLFFCKSKEEKIQKSLSLSLPPWPPKPRPPPTSSGRSDARSSSRWREKR